MSRDIRDPDAPLTAWGCSPHKACGFEVRGFGFRCVEGDACGLYLHPGDRGHADVGALHAAARVGDSRRAST